MSHRCFCAWTHFLAFMEWADDICSGPAARSYVPVQSYLCSPCLLYDLSGWKTYLLTQTIIICTAPIVLAFISSFLVLGIVDKSVELLSSGQERLTLENIFHIADRVRPSSWEANQIDNTEYCKQFFPGECSLGKLWILGLVLEKRDKKTCI